MTDANPELISAVRQCIAVLRTAIAEVEQPKGDKGPPTLEVLLRRCLIDFTATLVETDTTGSQTLADLQVGEVSVLQWITEWAQQHAPPVGDEGHPRHASSLLMAGELQSRFAAWLDAGAWHGAKSPLAGLPTQTLRAELGRRHAVGPDALARIPKGPGAMRPSDLDLCGPVPLAGTFGFVAAEKFAAILVSILVCSGDTWRFVKVSEIASYAYDRPSWMDDSFRNPPLDDMVGVGLVEWGVLGVEQKTVRLTETALARLQTSRWNRQPKRGPAR